jgi:hypothetical protein
MTADDNRPRARCVLDDRSFRHVRDARLHLLLGHWLEQRGADAVPRRAAIDPAAIVPVLPYIWLCEYLPEERRFRMRLAGEEINKLYGRNIARSYFEEITDPKIMPATNRRYGRIIEEPAILHCAGRIYFTNSSPVVGERLGLPLRTEDGRTTQIIGASVFDFPPEQYDFNIAGEAMSEIYTPIFD